MPDPKPSLILSRLTTGGTDAAARLIHQSLAVWYARHLNQPDRFGQDWEPFRIFPEVYEALDPGQAVTATDALSGELLGLCFMHPRPTHIAIGIVATLPESGSRGVARAMMEEVIAVAEAQNKPLRLVSSLMNLDSFSLYTRLGFVPGMVFQDLQFPPGILPPLVPPQGTIRPAVPADVPEIAALEEKMAGIRRDRDFSYFISNAGGIWHTLVLIGDDGKLRGFLGSIHQGGTQMLGPGWMADDHDALALITAQLHHHAPGNPVFLVPARAAGLVAALYRTGARNVELHVAQARGAAPAAQGIILPTFLPESG